jgi:hypothetical protein
MLNSSIFIVFKRLKDDSFIVFFSWKLKGSYYSWLYHLFPKKFEKQNNPSMDSRLLDLVYLMPLMSYLLNFVERICYLMLIVDLFKYLTEFIARLSDLRCFQPFGKVTLNSIEASKFPQILCRLSLPLVLL